MAHNTGSIKALKGGKISFKMTRPVKRTLDSAIDFRLSLLGDTDELRTMILNEIWEKIKTGPDRLKLSRYECTCLFEDEMIKLIPDQYQALLFATINPELKPIEMK